MYVKNDKVSYTISELNGGGEWVQVQYQGTISRIIQAPNGLQIMETNHGHKLHIRNSKLNNDDKSI